MKEENPFDELRIENETRYDEYKMGIYHNVNSRRGNWSFLGDIAELYIPKIIAVFLGNLGDKKSKK